MRSKRRQEIRQERARLRSLTTECVAIAHARAADAANGKGEPVWAPFKPSAWRGHTPLITGVAIETDEDGNQHRVERANFNMRGGWEKHSSSLGTTEKRRDGGFRFVPNRNAPAPHSLTAPSRDVDFRPPVRLDRPLPSHVVDVRGEYEKAVYAALEKEEAQPRVMLIPAPASVPPAPRWPSHD